MSLLLYYLTIDGSGGGGGGYANVVSHPKSAKSFHQCDVIAKELPWNNSKPLKGGGSGVGEYQIFSAFERLAIANHVGLHATVVPFVVVAAAIITLL